MIDGPKTAGRSAPDPARLIRLGRRLDWALTVALFVIAIWFVYMLRDLPVRATVFPWFIAGSMVIVAILYAIGKLRRPDRWDHCYEVPEETIDEAALGPAHLLQRAPQIGIALAAFIGLSLLIYLIGHEYAVPIFVAAYLLVRRENWIVAVVSGLALWALIHFVFSDFMSINLPAGTLIELLT